MPIPTPTANEEKNAFISRCMSVLQAEFPVEAQAAAVCFLQWEKREFSTNKDLRTQKFYDWDVCIADMKEQGYSDDVAAKICGSIKAGR